MSLDGFIASRDGGVDWLDGFQGQGEEALTEFYASIDGILMGSRTYEFALAHPPWQTSDRPSWVFTERRLPIADPSVTLTTQAPERLLEELGKKGHRRLWLLGGGRLAASFLDAGLMTRCMLCVMPILLGSGVPVVAPTAGENRLDLLDVERFEEGSVMLTYGRSPSGS